jgi:hypothetical protein
MSKYCDVGTKNQVGTQEVEAILIVLVYWNGGQGVWPNCCYSNNFRSLLDSIVDLTIFSIESA